MKRLLGFLLSLSLLGGSAAHAQTATPATAPAAGTGTMSLTVVSPCGVFTLADGFSYPVTRPAGQVAGGGSLAFTGSDPSLLALIAILLTLMGGAVIVRRRLAA